jgi:hypothetical protein
MLSYRKDELIDHYISSLLKSSAAGKSSFQKIRDKWLMEGRLTDEEIETLEILYDDYC